MCNSVNPLNAAALLMWLNLKFKIKFILNGVSRNSQLNKVLILKICKHKQTPIIRGLQYNIAVVDLLLKKVQIVIGLA